MAHHSGCRHGDHGLMNGEVDWVEVALPDLLPLLETQPALRIQHQDPSGNQAFIRFNCLIPPFDNVDLRRAVMMAVEQQPICKPSLAVFLMRGWPEKKCFPGHYARCG